MEPEPKDQELADPAIELKRLLEIGSLLASTLTPEEVENLRLFMLDLHCQNSRLNLSNELKIR